MRTKFFQWMMAAILVCGTGVSIACSSDDDTVDASEQKVMSRPCVGI